MVITITQTDLPLKLSSNNPMFKDFIVDNEKRLRNYSSLNGYNGCVYCSHIALFEIMKMMGDYFNNVKDEEVLFETE